MIKFQTKGVDEVELKVRREGNVLDLVDFAALPKLALHVERAFHKVLKEMFPVWAVHNIGFHDLVEKHKLSYGDCFAEKANLVLMDRF